ncbi:DNA-binding transcriptional regulator, LysR family [Desulfurobacterium pacificum]|uniref:DNA-binding transcriptional regulator, LysR family n=1 Tax=Desulfurobacterium pacificum TaxID=240166 RepID=A0ABY1NL90_9BACT|nr:selenium metabolism-associated LysR family transcriptional regulator [Desulfurobacterium pacificum]SMP12693.1 DNA-binding transcriptional regulator, LysR family [Desulfurobacterium pacificum]
MEIRQLEVFCQVYEQKSFSKAAERLGISQPTVSSHIQHLEDFLGKKLFDRTGKKVIPTPEAKVLYRYALDILKKRSEALSEILSIEKSSSGILKIGASNIPGDYLIPSALKKIKAYLPEVILHVEISDSSKVLKLLKENFPEIDLGIVGTKTSVSSLEWKEVGRDEIVLIAPPFFKNSSIPLSDLMELPLFFRETDSGTRKTVEERLKRKGIDSSTLKVAGILGSNTAIKEAVKTGEGFGLVSRLSVKKELQCGELKIVKIEGLRIIRKFYAVRRKDITPQPAARIFWEKVGRIF